MIELSQDIQIIALLAILGMMVVFFVLELLPMEVTALTTIGMLWLFKIINI